MKINATAEIQQQLKTATELLEKAGIESGEAKASASFLYKEATDLAEFERWLKRRKKHEPVDYIIGHKPFAGVNLLLTKDVLIPRPETEVLVGLALEWLKDPAHVSPDQPVRIADLGTGSGAIAIALAKSLDELLINYEIEAVELDAKAFAVAQKNITQNKVKNITLILGSLTDQLTAEPDLIIANLPYLPDERADSIAAEVIEYEPLVALFGGETGFELYQKLIIQLREKDWRPALFFEIDESQKEISKATIKKELNRVPRIINDLAELPRYCVVTDYRQNRDRAAMRGLSN